MTLTMQNLMSVLLLIALLLLPLSTITITTRFIDPDIDPNFNVQNGLAAPNAAHSNSSS